MSLLGAQATKPAEKAADGSTSLKALLRQIPGDFLALPSRANIVPSIVGTGLALGAHEFDDDVNRHFEGRGSVDDFYYPGKIIGQSYVQLGAAATIYAVGRLKDRAGVAYLGMDLLRAQALTTALTIGLKITVRRERPDGSDNMSFPSGHASFTFATAAVLERHLGWPWAVPTYLIAAYTATSRLHENKHFLSDVMAGATIGYICGRTVMRQGRPAYTLVPVIERKTAALLVVHVW